jgi:hypothetical protein
VVRLVSEPRLAGERLECGLRLAGDTVQYSEFVDRPECVEFRLEHALGVPLEQLLGPERVVDEEVVRPTAEEAPGQHRP